MSAPSSCAPPARPTCCPTSAGSSRPPRPVVEMEGAERIMLGSNNYLGLTGDARVIQGARDALDRYGTGLTGSRLLNGTIDLHLELERRARRVDGHRGGDRLHDRPPGQRRLASGTILGPGDTVIADSGDHASILDGCLLSRAKLRAVPPRPARQAREDARARGRRRRRRARRRRRRLLDGGRRRRPAARSSSSAKAHGARLMVDEAHARRRARRPRRRRQRAARRRGRRRPADGHVLEVAGLAAAASSPARTRSIDFLRDQLAGVPVHRRRRARPRSAPRWPRCGSSAPTRARSCSRRVLDNAALPARRPARPRLRGRSTTARDGRRRRSSRRRRRRLEGRAALARALRRRRLRQRRPAPGGPAGRRAAAHERDGDPRPSHAGPRARGVFDRSSSAFEAEHGPLPGDAAHIAHFSRLSRDFLTFRKEPLLANFRLGSPVDHSPARCLACALRSVRCAPDAGERERTIDGLEEVPVSRRRPGLTVVRAERRTGTLSISIGGAHARRRAVVPCGEVSWTQLRQPLPRSTCGRLRRPTESGSHEPSSSGRWRRARRRLRTSCSSAPGRPRA